MTPTDTPKVGLFAGYRRLWRTHLRGHWKSLLLALILMAVVGVVSALYAKFVQVLIAAMEAHPDLTLKALTAYVYDEVDPKLHRLASRSLLAHLLKLEVEDRAVRVDERWRLVARQD